MPKIDDVTAEGKSGTRYGFEVYPLATTFNDVGAVYLFMKRSNGAGAAVKYDVVYVGETGQLRTRLSNHEKWPCATKNGANCIGVHSDGGERSRLEKEKDLRKSYPTSCNEQ